MSKWQIGVRTAKKRSGLSAWGMIFLVLATMGLGWSRELKDLYRLFQVDMPRGDVAILLDASGSMKEEYTTVRDAVVDFAKTLDESEDVSLRVFAQVPCAPREGNGREIRQQVKKYLPLQTLPGSGTDLGLALEKGVVWLEREGASPTQALFLLTDGHHQPLPDSPYSQDFDGDADWQNLRQRAHTLSPQRTLLVYGLGLGEHTDIAVLRRVFPAQAVEVIVGQPGEVGRVLAQMRERLRRARLRQAVHEELEAGRVTVELPQIGLKYQGGIPSAVLDVPAQVRNGYPHLPVVIRNVTATTPEEASQVPLRVQLENPPEEALLEPQGQQEFRVRIDLVSPPSRWRLGKVEERYQADYQLSAGASFQLQAALAELGIDDPVRVQPAALPVDIRLRVGVPIWIVGGVGVGLVLALIGLCRMRPYQPLQAPPGTLVRSGDKVETIDLSRFGKTQVEIGPGKDIEVALPAAPVGGVMAVLSVEEEGDWAYLRLESHHPAVQVNGIPVPSGSSRRLEVSDNLEIGRVTFTVTGETQAQVRFTHPLLCLLGVVLMVVFILLLFHVDP